MFNILMGQNNCYCQYGNSDEEPRSSLLFANPSPSQQKAMKFFNAPRYINLPRLQEQRSATSMRFVHSNPKQSMSLVLPNGNQSTYLDMTPSFKLEVAMKDNMVHLRDCGVGLGVFAQRRKVQQKADNSQLLLDITGTFLMLHFLRDKSIECHIYQDQREVRHELSGQTQVKNIELGNETLQIQQKEAKDYDYTIRLKSKECMYVYLGSPTKVKEGDQFRIGQQKYRLSLSPQDIGSF